MGLNNVQGVLLPKTFQAIDFFCYHRGRREDPIVEETTHLCTNRERNQKWDASLLPTG